MDKEAYFSETGVIEAQVYELVLELKAKKEGRQVGPRLVGYASSTSTRETRQGTHPGLTTLSVENTRRK